MASIQSHILDYAIRRLNLIGGGNPDPVVRRERLERSARILIPPRAVQIVRARAGPTPAEWLIPPGTPADRVLLYIHGGGWRVGSAKTHRGFVSRLACASGVRALSIDYRLAPEHPFPAGLDDCAAAYEWLLQNGVASRKIVIAGDSAGGNLALALLVRLRDAGKPLPAGAVAISPAPDLTFSGESHRTRKALDPFFWKDSGGEIVSDYIGDLDPRHPLISPVYADLHGLPPLLIHIGDHEVLLDDAVRFGERAAAAGVDVKTVVWPEMFHVFQIFTPLLPEARRASAQIAEFIASRLNAG